MRLGHLLEDCDNRSLLRTLWATMPQGSFAVVLKKRHPDIYGWVIDHTDDQFTTFNERVRWLLNPVDLYCARGNRRKLSPHTYEYGFCGSPGTCDCHRQAVTIRSQTNGITRTAGFLEKRKKTWLAKYGTDNPMKSEGLRRQASITKTGKPLNRTLDTAFDKVVSRVADSVRPLFDLSEYNGVSRQHHYAWECVKCSTHFTSHVDFGTTPKCPTCWPKEVSAPELEIRAVVSDLGMQAQFNTKSVIPPYELDIYLSELALAIEFNGDFWHSSIKRKPSYHVDKWRRTYAAGVALVQIYGHEWTARRSAVIYQLTNWLRPTINGLTVEPVGSELAEAHIRNNTLLEWSPTDQNLALTSNGRIAAMITLTGGNITHCDVSCTHHLQRLIPHIPAGAIVEVSRDWPTGQLLSQVGFTEITSDPDNSVLRHVKNGLRVAEHLADDSHLKIHDSGRARYQLRML